MMNKKKFVVTKELYKDDEIGEVIKEGSIAYFNIPMAVSGFKDMQEIKTFIRKNRSKMLRVLERYCELSMTTKFLDKDTVAKAQNKTVELVLKKLGYIS